MEKVKDIVFDKIVDEILDIIVGKSKSEIENLISQNRNQKILGRCMQKIADSDMFKTEYADVTFVLDWKSIYSIDDEKISVALEKSEIVNNIADAVKKCFVSDNDNSNRISELVVEKYVQQAKTTIQVYEIIKQQHQNFENMDDAISDVKELIISNKRNEERLLIEKEQLFKQELYNEVNNYIFDIINRYLYLVCKCSPELDNPSKAPDFDVMQLMRAKLKDVIDNIDKYVNEDFCLNSIRLLRVNGLQHVEEDMEYFKFMEFEFKNKILKSTREILEYRDIIDTETYVYLLRIRNSLNGPLFPSLYEMGQVNIIKNNNIRIDVEDFRIELRVIGENILKLSDKFRS